MPADTLRADPLFRNCLRTNCPSGQIHEAGDAEPLMICAACGYKMCYLHSLPWHEGQTCTQYDDSQRHRVEDDASLALIAEVTKPCPGERCGVPIQKNQGCDHVTCKPELISYDFQSLDGIPGYSCRHEFCWQCLQPYGPIRRHGNVGHAATCRYHSDNLPRSAILYPQTYFPNG